MDRLTRVRLLSPHHSQFTYLREDGSEYVEETRKSKRQIIKDTQLTTHEQPIG